MQRLDIPAILKDRVSFYNTLWGKKMRGEDLGAFSHLISDDFSRTVRIDTPSDGFDKKEPSNLLTGEIIFEDKTRGLCLTAQVKGDLVALRDHTDKDISHTKKTIFDYCKLDGDVRFETNSQIMRGYYREGNVMGGFFKEKKLNKLSGEKGPKDGTIIETIRQLYNTNGQPNGRWYTQNQTRQISVLYRNGEKVVGSKQTKYFDNPKLHSSTLMDKLLSFGVVLHIVQYVSKRRNLDSFIKAKENPNQRH